METSASHFIKNMAVIRKLVTSYSKELFLVCLQVIFVHCTNRAEIFTAFLPAKSIYSAGNWRVFSPMHYEHQLSSKNRYLDVCICVTETAESI